MRVVFFGTPSFAVGILADLLAHGVDVVAVVTGQDKRKGRMQKWAFPPVKTFILSQFSHIPVFQPCRASDASFVDVLRNYDPEVFVVASYGQMLRNNLLMLPTRMSLNVHPSLLPLYRGPSPIRTPLLHGDRITGVSIMQMVLEMDAGDILAQEIIDIPCDMTHGELEEELSHLSCRLLRDVLCQLDRHEILSSCSQNHSQATFTQKLTKEDQVIIFDRPARDVHNQIRALSPHPGGCVFVRMKQAKKRMKILRSQVIDISSPGPGKNLFFTREDGWIVGCQDLALRLIEVQIEGKKMMAVRDLLSGLRDSLSFC